MAKTLHNSQIKRDRRSLLGALRTVYPGWMEGEELYLLIVDVNPEYDRRICVKDLFYLNEKGYLRFKGNAGIDVHTISVKNCLFQLTAKGTEVADRLVDDPTLEV